MHKHLRHVERVFLVVGVIIALITLVLLGKTYFHRDSGSSFSLTSTVFQNGGTIPARYTCAQENISPSLQFSGVPPNAKSLALVMHDPDALGGDFTHWLVWNIPPPTKGFNEGNTVAKAFRAPPTSVSRATAAPARRAAHTTMFSMHMCSTLLSISRLACTAQNLKRCSKTTRLPSPA